jgi:hypothetical protein
MEQLESRQVLSASAANVFAQFHGEISQPFESQSVEVFLIPGNFQLGFGPATVGFLARPADGSDFAPAPVKVESLNPFDRGRRMPVAESRPALPDGGSVALVPLKRGVYKVEVAGGDTVGKWQLDVFLAGDVNGDFKVTAEDVGTLYEALLAGNASPELLAVGDSNRDGFISILDVQVAQDNRGSATSTRPLTVSAQLAAESDSGVAGDNIVGLGDVQIVGRTLPRAHVGLDVDGDGFDDGGAFAKSNNEPTNFKLNAALSHGANSIRVRASDNFGQSVTTELVVMVDAIRPDVLSTSPADEVIVQEGIGGGIPVQIVFTEPMIADSVVQGLTVSGNRSNIISPTARTYDPVTKTLSFEIDPTLPDSEVTISIDGRAMDLAGNGVANFEFSFGRRPMPGTILTESDFFTRRLNVPVQLGQPAGTKTLSFDLAVFFDTTSPSSDKEDRLVVYIANAVDPGIPLWENVSPWLPIFSISPDGAEFLADIVSFDGTTVEIDVSSIVGDTAGLLQFQLQGSDADNGSRARIGLVESQTG